MLPSSPVRSRVACRAAAAFLLAALTARGAGGDAVPARYAVVLERAPFGPPPPTGGAGAAEGAAAAEGGAAAEGAANAVAAEEGDNPCPLRLVALTRFEGVPAAGFHDTESGRSFLLRPGDSAAGWTLLELDSECAATLLADASGREVLVSMTWAPGQATQLLPSPREPYLTTFHPSSSSALSGDGHAMASGAPSGASGGGDRTASGQEETGRGGRPAPAPVQGGRAALSPEEEAALAAKATVVGPDGERRLSYRLLQRLRVEVTQRKAAAARAEAEARAAELERQQLELLAVRRAEEEREGERAKKAEAVRRAGIVAAIGAGYDVEVDFELDAQEAATLRDAGYDVPDDALEEE